MLELARALAEDGEPDADLYEADTSQPLAGVVSSPDARAPRRKRDGGAIAEWQQAKFDIICPEPDPKSAHASRPGVGNWADTTSLERLKYQLNVACHGAGAGASMGLLRAIFQRFDADGDGVITRDELRRGLALQGVDFGDADFAALMDQMDLDGDGEVSATEFAHAIAGGMEFDAPEHEYYARRKRKARSPEWLRENLVAVPVSLLAEVFKACRRAGAGKAVPCARLAEELNRHALLDLVPEDLQALVPAGRDGLALEDLYSALFGQAGDDADGDGVITKEEMQQAGNRRGSVRMLSSSAMAESLGRFDHGDC